MSHPFDFQSEDPYLRFIGTESSHSGLFKNQHTPVKVEEYEMKEQYSQPKPQTQPTKRKRSDNQSKANSRKKVFYREKMASLISEQEMQGKEEYNYGDFSHHGRGKSPIPREQQLKRNRQSAKNSRMRKKEYVQALQEKNNQNQKLIQELKERLEEAERERDKLRDENRSYIKEFINSKSEAYDKMSDVLRLKGKKCTELINEELKILKAKFGAAGSERVATTDFYMKEILGILTGDIHKYLMNCALENSGLFGTNQWTTLDDKICEILGVSKDIRVPLSKTYREQMFHEFEMFKDLTKRFYDSYLVVQNQAKAIQKIFDKVLLQFNNQNIANLLLWIEENKFQKQIKKLRADWISSIINPVEATGHPRKLSRYQLQQH